VITISEAGEIDLSSNIKMWGSDDENQEEKDTKFKINKEYAKKYQTKKEREELQDLSKRDLSDDESSSDEEEDEIGILDKPELDNKFLEVVSMIHNQDPRVYEKKEFFPEVDEESQKVKKI